MSELRKQMKMYIELKGYSNITTKYYLTHVSNFVKHYKKSPDLLGKKEICEYLHYCITEKHLTEGYIGPIYTVLKIFYAKVLNQIWDVNRIPRIKERRRLPVVLYPQEITAIFDTTKNIKHKTILMTIYSGGLRVIEACNLKILDIDSKNMQIFIRQGKGKKDRYTLLSKTNLQILRKYWKIYQPKKYLFSGRYRTDSITPRSVQEYLKRL